MNNMWKTIFTTVVSSVVTGAVVFGFTVAGVVGPIKEQIRVEAVQITYLQQSDTEQRAMIAADKAEFVSRISTLTGLVSEQTKENGELITLLRLQNQINAQKN